MSYKSKFDSPCYECKERDKYGECHSTCSRYLNYQRIRKELRDLREKARLSEPPKKYGR